MNRWLFYTAVALQVIFLMGMGGSYYAMDRFGDTIVLETEPLDPRDPFYGDYVTVRYSIEDIPVEMWEDKKEPARGDTVFITVEEQGSGYYELVKASPQSERAKAGQVELKAKFEWHNQQTDTYQVNIGLDRYFIEEGTGNTIEQAGDATAEIVVAPWGQKKIISLE
ncbi:GDYXXLXY domain-containing protein [Halobacillus sp. A1]|uniref:GDYXXLXY domain-containing protein n=1 Tax=Halobacillus sp. A1 TaxID=2880262 RepID=UPI0020A69DF8|nr:GDYXXLXY domain-containing protein [Halobacillus sp. A1]MCP3032013.1 GDYXXLXY domain-containing protein [Halobacillus sp. A1]